MRKCEVGSMNTLVLSTFFSSVVCTTIDLLSSVDEEEPETITDEGIEKFCSDLAIDTQDVAILLIAWKMEAANMCVFTYEEWNRGMAALG